MDIRTIAVALLAGLLSTTVSAQIPTRRLGGLSPTIESLAAVDAHRYFAVRYLATPQQDGKAAVEFGRSLFSTYCASCHGPEARGGGPVAAQLRQQVPDLTRFALRNGGVFPSVRVTRIIDGREILSHGSTEMPVWGDAFIRKYGVLTAEDVARRIAALTAYLEAIQDRNGE